MKELKNVETVILDNGFQKEVWTDRWGNHYSGFEAREMQGRLGPQEREIVRALEKIAHARKALGSERKLWWLPFATPKPYPQRLALRANDAGEVWFACGGSSSAGDWFNRVEPDYAIFCAGNNAQKLLDALRCAALEMMLGRPSLGSGLN